MVGALFGCGNLPIKIETVKECIKERVPAKALETNLKAFDMGSEACK
jgi:Pyruvate/2-oxoacid:ferredoxin oxidoreductase gamma subunit